jgi:hypothetical protein
MTFVDVCSGWWEGKRLCAKDKRELSPASKMPAADCLFALFTKQKAADKWSGLSLRNFT